MYNLTQSVHVLWMNGAFEVANRVQLMSRSSEHSHRLSLAYFLLCSFHFFGTFNPHSFSFTSFFPSSVPQPLLSPSFSGSQLYKGVWLRVSEWALWRQSIPYQLLPNTDTLTSLTANYYFFMTQPGAITATSLRCILLLLQLSKGVPGGILEELRHQSLSPSQILQRQTDRQQWNGGDRVQSEKRGSHSSMPKDSVNSCILLKFLFWEHSVVCLEGCWLTVRMWQSFVVVVGAGKRASCSCCLQPSKQPCL